MGGSDQRYGRAQALAHELLDLPRAERAARLAAACGDDAALRRETEWLIDCAECDDDSAPAALQRIDALRRDVTTGRIETDAPRHYRLLERLGEGGMGQVWLAERDSAGVHQRVALKLLRGAAPPTAGELARFLAEGRILAALSHPNIAHLVDAGIGADGLPFLAMEYVDGERVDRWCDAHAPALRARIALFLKICAAVEYAHGRLVIHRDLKPANILVDRSGEAKLLDFGIARLLDADAGGNATTVLNAMTTAYASPEQIRGEPLGTASDIYSLGVVLYELVAGVRPFDHISSGHERANAVVAGEITPPSRSTRAATAGGPSVSRSVAPARRIPADLDAIVLKALRREPAQRYASVAELAADLRNFLAARPVLARRGQRGYRMRRFLWRNRWPLAAAIAMSVIAAGFTWRTVLAEREARAQARTAERATDFLTSLFAASDANLNAALRHDLSAREVLDTGAARIDLELVAEPRLRARLLEAVGNAYRHMNDNNRAAGLMREAATLNLSPAVDDPLAGARCLEALANLLANGEFPAAQAEDAARRSLELAQRLTPAGSQAIANAWMVLSLAQNRAGNYAAAQVSADTTLRMNLALRNTADNRLTAAYNNRCIILANRGEQVAAERACTSGIALHQADGSGASVGAAMTLSRQAQSRAALFDATGADAAMRQALDIVRAAQGDDGPFVALFRLRQAVILDDRGDYAQAGELLDHTLDTQAQLNGKASGEYAAVQLEIARRHLLLGELDAALPQLRERVAASITRYGADDPRALDAQTLLAQALLDGGHADAAARAALDAANLGWASKDDTAAPAALAAAATLAQWFAMRGDATNAQPLLDRVLARDARSDVWTRTRADLARATLARTRGDAAAALDAERIAYERLRDVAGARHPQAARVGLRYAHALRVAGHDGAAEALERSLRPILEQAFPQDSAFRGDHGTPI